MLYTHIPFVCIHIQHIYNFFFSVKRKIVVKHKYKLKEWIKEPYYDVPHTKMKIKIQQVVFFFFGHDRINRLQCCIYRISSIRFPTRYWVTLLTVDLEV